VSDSSPSVTLGPVSSPLMWPPGIPVVAAVEWRAPELKPEQEWDIFSVETFRPSTYMCFPCPIYNARLPRDNPRDRLSVRVQP
jgi:hypothetical protein